MGPGKPVVLGLSILLVVGIAIGLIVSVHNISSKDDSEDPFASTSKAVAAICSQMDYQRTCIDSLSSIAFNKTATSKDFLAVAINVTIDAVKTGMERSGVIAKGANEPRQKMAFEDCNELLTLAIHELQAAFASVGDSQNQTVVDGVDELRNWLSATI